MWRNGREECILGLSYITCGRNPTSSGRVSRPRLRMRTTPRGSCRGELARTRPCNPRLSGGALRPTLRLYRRPGKRQRHPYPRAPPPVRSSRRSLGAEPLAAWGARCPASDARRQSQIRWRGDRMHSEGPIRRPFQSQPRSQHVAVLPQERATAQRRSAKTN